MILNTNHFVWNELYICIFTLYYLWFVELLLQKRSPGQLNEVQRCISIEEKKILCFFVLMMLGLYPQCYRISISPEDLEGINVLPQELSIAVKIHKLWGILNCGLKRFAIHLPWECLINHITPQALSPIRSTPVRPTFSKKYGISARRIKIDDNRFIL